MRRVGMIKRFFSSFALLVLFAAFAHATDLAITAANVVPSAKARTSQQTAGATITAGQVVYLDSVSGTVKLAKANGTLAQATVFGIAAGNASTNQPVVIITYDPALTFGGTFASLASLPVLSGNNAGGITTAAGPLDAGWASASGWIPVSLGVALSTTTMFFNPVLGTTAM